jgi:phosphoribosylformimino-5-aminoimidazole carboxamide ribotide isomerase
MRILPVLDLKGGQVVRGLAGRRQEYRPVVSLLTPSCRPVDVALAFRAHFDLTDLYLADLDAIAGSPPALPTYTELGTQGFRLWVDAGLRTAAGAQPLVATGIDKIVVGLETVRGPAALDELSRTFGADRIAFSLDLKEGLPLGDLSAWNEPDAWSIAAQAIAAGIRHLIVLDLTRVGVGAGTGTEDLAARLAAAYPAVEVAAGGGVRDVEDLQRLQSSGVRAVLVASALHDGRLRREHLDQLRRAPLVDR